MARNQLGLTKTEDHLSKLAYTLGTLQALTWSVLSTICLVLYLEPSRFPQVDSHMDQISYLIYGFFLAREVVAFRKQVVKPRVFFGFAWVYFCLNLVLLVVSLKNLLQTKNQRIIRDVRLWGGITLLISMVDLLVVILLGVDYHNCKDLYNYHVMSLEEACANGILPVLVVVAKGFVLWFVNIAFAWVLLKMAQRIKRRQIYQASTSRFRRQDFQNRRPI